MNLKYSLKNKRYVFCEELDYGDRYSSEIPFNLDYDVYSYEIDDCMKGIVDQIVRNARNFVFSEIHLKNIVLHNYFFVSMFEFVYLHH